MYKMNSSLIFLSQIKVSKEQSKHKDFRFVYSSVLKFSFMNPKEIVLNYE